MPKVQINGINIHYELKGNLKSSKTICLLNGVMASFNSWYSFLKEFEKDYKILLHDFRGQLLSDKPDENYTFEKHSYDLKKLLQVLKIKETHIIGTSYGSIVGMDFAATYPNYSQSLSLICTLAHTDELFISQTKNLKMAAENVFLIPDKKKAKTQFFYQVIPLIFTNSYLKENKLDVENRTKAISQLPDDYFQGQANLLENAINNNHLIKKVEKITCPTLIISGGNDIFTPIHFANNIIKKRPKTKHIIRPHLGHGAFIEEPAQIAKIVNEFIQKKSELATNY